MSKIYVDEIAPKTTGNQVIVPEFVPRPGQIIEHLSSQCDGSTLEGQSGTYTWPNVTAQQQLTATYADLTGSSITYTPPSGTARVHYRFEWKFEAVALSGISHYRFYIDSTEVIGAFRTIASDYQTNHHHEMNTSMEYTIHCNADSDDAANAKLASWATPKTLKIQAREYNATYQASAHENTWRDGAGAVAPYTVAVPVLTIIAVA